MNTPQEFSNEIKNVKNDFTNFVEKEQIPQKGQSAFDSLLEKERLVIAKTLKVPLKQLASYFIEKLKKKSIADGSITESNYLDLRIENLFKSGYSTNYDLEVSTFSKGTENIQFLIRNDFLNPDRDEAMQAIYKRIYGRIPTEDQEEIARKLNISIGTLEKYFVEHLAKNKVPFKNFSTYTTENIDDPIIHSYKNAMKKIAEDLVSEKDFFGFGRGIINHLEKKKDWRHPEHPTIIGGDLTIKYNHEKFPGLTNLNNNLIPNIASYAIQSEKIQQLTNDDKFGIIKETIGNIIKGTITNNMLNKEEFNKNLSLRHYDRLFGEDDGVGSNVGTEIEFKKHHAAQCVKEALAGILDLKLETETNGPDNVGTSFKCKIAESTNVEVANT